MCPRLNSLSRDTVGKHSTGSDYYVKAIFFSFCLFVCFIIVLLKRADDLRFFLKGRGNCLPFKIKCLSECEISPYFPEKGESPPQG